MTVTDPRGDPSLLQTVVAADHAQLAELLDEARKDTSPTPGVREQLVANLHRTLARHLNTESSVVHGEVDAELSEAEIEALARDQHRWRELYDGSAAGWNLDEVGAALENHIELFEALLAALREAVGGKRMATLGFQFGRSLDTASTVLVDRPSETGPIY